MLLTALVLTMAAPQCRGQEAALPRPLAGWTRTGKGLDTRHAMVLAARGGKAEARVTIRKAGVFGIAADQDGWIDLYRDNGRALRMASEARGPRCSTIRKIIRYRLQPGTYRVAVSRLTAPAVRVMLVHGEAPSRRR
ncbi:hypothetical protein ACG3SL_01350 [Sphingomonas sp. CJ20]